MGGPRHREKATCSGDTGSKQESHDSSQITDHLAVSLSAEAARTGRGSEIILKANHNSVSARGEEPDLPSTPSSSLCTHNLKPMFPPASPSTFVLHTPPSLCPSLPQTCPSPSKFGKLSSGHRTGKDQFHYNPKERQCQRMFKLLHNCTHFTS